jgi:DNA-directed RNA polymerase specialized sigma24 family protein
MFDTTLQEIDSARLSPDDIDTLLPLVRAGDKSAINKMILAHWSLAKEIAGYYAATWSAAYLYDDMISEGIMIITQKVHEIAAGTAMQKHDNISAFLRVCAFHAIGDWATKQHSLGSAKTQRKQFQLGGDSGVVKFHSIPCPEGAYFETDNDMLAVRDFLDSIPATVEEHTIMRMREEGCSYEDIGALLSMAPSTVYLLLQDIYSRFMLAEARLDVPSHRIR